MGLADLKLDGDTGWMATPRFAPQDILDSDGTIMHGLSSPSNRRILSGHLIGEGIEAFTAAANSREPTTIGPATGLILNVTGRRRQNTGDQEIWHVTIEMQEPHA